MIFNCCNRCQKFSNCSNRWMRGERDEEDICCTDCSHFFHCQQEIDDIVNKIAVERLIENGILDEKELRHTAKKRFYK